MTDQKPLRVALYSRVSTKDKGQDIRNQTDQLREFCQRQNWQIVKECTDHASGKRGDRMQFVALFDAASRREFDAVLFWSLDRFSREGTLPTLQYLQRLESYGVAYRSFTESWLDSLGPFKDVVLALKADRRRDAFLVTCARPNFRRPSRPMQSDQPGASFLEA